MEGVNAFLGKLYRQPYEDLRGIATTPDQELVNVHEMQLRNHSLTKTQSKLRISFSWKHNVIRMLSKLRNFGYPVLQASRF